MAMPRRDFAVTLLDGRRVIGRQLDRGEGWSVYVYPPDNEGPILGYAWAPSSGPTIVSRSGPLRSVATRAMMQPASSLA